MTLSPSQAAMLLELFNSLKAARRDVEDALSFSKEHYEALHKYASAESQLDAYITSLIGQPQTGETK